MSFDITFDTLLQEVLDRKASDLHISEGCQAMLRIDGSLVPTLHAPETKLTSEESRKICLERCDEKMISSLEESRELDFSFGFEEKARFRANVFFSGGARNSRV